MSEESATSGLCTGKIIVSEGRWKLQPEQSEACMLALEGLKKLGPAARAYVCSHVEPASPEQNVKTQEVCRIRSDSKV